MVSSAPAPRPPRGWLREEGHSCLWEGKWDLPIGSRALGTLGTSFSAMFPCFLGFKNSGDRVQNLVPRVPYGVPTLMVILYRKLANFEGPGSLWLPG